MTFTRSDLSAGAAYIAGGGLSAAFALVAILLEKPMNPHDVVMGASGAAISIAGLIRVVANRNGAPTQAIAAGAKIVPAGTSVVTSATKPIAYNVTSTSDILAPLKKG